MSAEEVPLKTVLNRICADFFQFVLIVALAVPFTLNAQSNVTSIGVEQVLPPNLPQPLYEMPQKSAVSLGSSGEWLWVRSRSINARLGGDYQSLLR